MTYELFQHKATRHSTPQLTIRSGRISFNADAGDLWEKCGRPLAHLLWDAAARKIGIRPAKKEDENTFRVSTPQGKRGKTISAFSFLHYIQWQTERHVVVDAVWNANEGMFEAEMPKDSIANAGAEPKKRRVKVI
jgi:hypothetical protein